MVAEPFPAVAESAVGAAGAVAEVVILELAVDAVEVPAAFVADTVKV